VATIQIDPRFEKWVQERVVRSFDLNGIMVTPTARLGLAYLMQAQLEEYRVLTPEQVLAGAEKLLGPILRGHRVKYQQAPLTINRALHLTTEANAFMWVFPTVPTDDWTEIQDKSLFVGEVWREKERPR
jgi:hypothetical protein